jgi:hypothetical protein
MSFKSETKKLSDTYQAPSITKWLEIIESLGEEGKELEEVLNDPSVSPTAILVALKKRNVEVSRNMIYTWRKALPDEP